MHTMSTIGTYLKYLGLKFKGSLLAAMMLMACTDHEAPEPMCDRNKNCPEGYTCLGFHCRKDGTVNENEICREDKHCSEGLICTSVPQFVCRKPCNSYYKIDQSCNNGEYCRPSAEVTDASKGDYLLRGSCVQSQCNKDSDCCNGSQSCGEICVRITPQDSACVASCIINWGAYDAYEDSCLDLNTEHCQPIGEPERLVCLSQGGTTSKTDGTCTAVENPCPKGQACHKGQCVAYCRVGNDTCSGNTKCTEVKSTDGSYGLCLF